MSTTSSSPSCQSFSFERYHVATPSSNLFRFSQESCIDFMSFKFKWTTCPKPFPVFILNVWDYTVVSSMFNVQCAKSYHNINNVQNNGPHLCWLILNSVQWGLHKMFMYNQLHMSCSWNDALSSWKCPCEKVQTVAITWRSCNQRVCSDRLKHSNIV